VEHAVRLLRSGGVLAMDNMLWHDQVADPAARDATTTALRDLGKSVRDHVDLVPALLPVSDGLLVAVRR
jgi:predicted O-methyltransferase YrrM